MYDLFQKRSPIDYTITLPPEFDILRRAYRRELKKITQYYQNRNFMLPTSHLLCRLLNNLSIPQSYNFEMTTMLAEARSDAISKTMRFSSPLSIGRIFKGPFYGQESDEFLLYTSFDGNIQHIVQQWKNFSAITILLHPLSNLALLQPVGKKINTENGLSIIGIDIVALVIQYRCFLMQQVSSGDRENASMTIPTFLRRYVLPNMLYQQTDLVIINRLMNLFYGKPMGVGAVKYTFPIHNYGNYIDKVLSKILKNVEKKQMRYEAVLQHIPGITNKDAQKTLMLPDMPLTRQIHWLFILSRLTIIKFLIDLGGKPGIVGNRDLLIRLQRTLRTFAIENQWATVLPSDLYYNVQIITNEISAIR